MRADLGDGVVPLAPALPGDVQPRHRVRVLRPQQRPPLAEIPGGNRNDMQKLYELRVFRGAEEVPFGSPLRYPLDFTNLDATLDVLQRHLVGAAERHGAERKDAHLFHLTIREVDRYNNATGGAINWAVPADEVDEEEVPRR